MTNSFSLTKASVIELTRVPLNSGMTGYLTASVSKVAYKLFANLFSSPAEWIIVDDFKIQRQCHTRWCWAAVAASMARAYYPSTACTQQSIAKKYLDILQPGNHYTYDSPCYNGKLDDAAQDDALPYNVYGILESVLVNMGCFEHLYPHVDHPAPLDQMQTWIEGDDKQSRRVVCVRIRWPNGGTHFVAVVGYRPGTEDLYVCDPWGPAENVVSYEELSEHYTDNDGCWVDTLFTKRSQDPTQMCAGN